MSSLKDKIHQGDPVFGGWTLTGNPAVAEIMAAEGFDFLAADMEHTPISMDDFYHIALAVKGTGCDLQS
jgi:2-keto-3-deoxy-L-rhamnonate aldolase RhmA